MAPKPIREQYFKKKENIDPPTPDSQIIKTIQERIIEAHPELVTRYLEGEEELLNMMCSILLINLPFRSRSRRYKELINSEIDKLNI